ncbi:LysM peptidoglycan-binding domain-containing protein [Verrucomicrobiales bacterium]|jgi:LysM repeat protein|nr:LysM peptidoglycan-binding domain-containing protein [Verrucomicrobiales bacterium]
MGKARAKKRLAANITEEHDWYLDTPDVRLTRIFTIVLALHAIAFVGIVAFKMVDKASATTGITISSASKNAYRNAVAQEKTVSAAATAAQPAEAKARKKPPAPLRRTPGASNQYKVQAGESLQEIASELEVSAEAIRGANSIISDNELYPGRWLTIPDKTAVPTQSVGNVTSDKPKPAQRTQPRVYEVAPGDTAWGIASKLNVSYKELLSINGVARPETLQIGQKLKVPASN